MRNILFSFLATALVSGAHAQFRSLDDSSRGDGTFYQQGNGTRSIDRATVRLLHNNKFTITVSGQRSGTFTGKWDLSGARHVMLDVKTVNETHKQVNGRGHMTLTGGMQVTNFEMDGEVGGQPFRVRYDARLGSSGGGWTDSNRGGSTTNTDRRDFSDTIRGSGTLIVDGDRSKIETAQITIRNERFTIRFRGAKDVTFEGTATRQGRNDYKLRVSRGFSRAVSGEGTLSVRPDGNARSVILDGRADGKRYRVEVTD